MNYRPGATVPVTGIYWCTVCKSPEGLPRASHSPSARTCAAAACGNWWKSGRSRGRSGWAGNNSYNQTGRGCVQ